jgi:membrane-bound metal-dependent hydrolase YbcI (DUF457 family)
MILMNWAVPYLLAEMAVIGTETFRESNALLPIFPASFPLLHVAYVTAWSIALALAVTGGWMSHLAADRLSPTPMPLLWPISRRPIGPVRFHAHKLVARGWLVEHAVIVFSVVLVVRGMVL